jgi:hypothetical protein
LKGAEGALAVWGVEERVAELGEDVHYGLEGGVRTDVPNEADGVGVDGGVVESFYAVYRFLEDTEVC